MQHSFSRCPSCDWMAGQVAEPLLLQLPFSQSEVHLRPKEAQGSHARLYTKQHCVPVPSLEGRPQDQSKYSGARSGH